MNSSSAIMILEFSENKNWDGKKDVAHSRFMYSEFGAQQRAEYLEEDLKICTKNN